VLRLPSKAFDAANELLPDSMVEAKAGRLMARLLVVVVLVVGVVVGATVPVDPTSMAPISGPLPNMRGLRKKSSAIWLTL